MNERTLTHEEARAFYDGFGKLQDWQRVYEGPALRDLIEHSRFPEATAILEFGCGTGFLATTLLQPSAAAGWKPAPPTYLGLDISETMVRIAAERVRPFGERAEVRQTNGTMDLPVAAESVSHLVSAYVLDLLSVQDIAHFVREAHRVLIPGGRLCLVSLTSGRGIFARAVTRLWRWAHRLSPRRVGGCRPIDLRDHLEPGAFSVEHESYPTTLGLTSQVIVAIRGRAGT